MTNTEPTPGGEDKKPAHFPPGLKQALEQLFIKYISPVIDRLDRLDKSLKSDDARELAALRESLRKCELENQQLKYALADEQTNARTARENADMWRERNDAKASQIADLTYQVASLESRLKNCQEGH